MFNKTIFRSLSHLPLIIRPSFVRSFMVSIPGISPTSTSIIIPRLPQPRRKVKSDALYFYKTRTHPPQMRASFGWDYLGVSSRRIERGNSRKVLKFVIFFLERIKYIFRCSIFCMFVCSHLFPTRIHTYPVRSVLLSQCSSDCLEICFVLLSLRPTQYEISITS